MKKIILFLFLSFSSSAIVAQKYLNNLTFDGNQYWNNDSNFVLTDYKTGTPVYQYIDSSDLLMSRFAAFIADSTGQLIFYTNGCSIGNKDFDMITGTDTLDYTSISISCPYGQHGINSGFFLNSLSDTNEILLFHNDFQGNYSFSNWVFGTSYNTWFTVLDKTMNNGLGGLVSRNNLFYNAEICRDGIQAVKHANGRDYWIVLQDFDTSNFITFLYTPIGFYGPYYQNMNIPLYRGGQPNALFNRQGTKYATTAWNNNLMLFDFDRCTGQFSYNNQVDTTWQYLGFAFCFSAGGNKIYRMDNSDKIYQYDTADVDFNISRDTVAIYDGYYDMDSTKFGGMYLAQDDKIYNGSVNGYIHVINKPDLNGLSCNIVQHAIKLPLYLTSAPNYINYDLGPLVGSPCDTLSVLTPVSPQARGLMQCFPNPATNEVNIKINNVPLGNYTLSIYSPLANEVMHIEDKNIAKDFTKTLRVHDLASGFYFVKLQVEGMVWYGRFVRE
ncbi:MAG: T9SS type A sorting domain-containing protein [Bacteroidetes bacterium]|nr:T9SS type A sorting domain-containing protein [Bacteroidota bacterium]